MYQLKLYLFKELPCIEAAKGKVAKGVEYRLHRPHRTRRRMLRIESNVAFVVPRVV